MQNEFSIMYIKYINHLSFIHDFQVLKTVGDRHYLSWSSTLNQTIQNTEILLSNIEICIMTV